MNADQSAVLKLFERPYEEPEGSEGDPISFDGQPPLVTTTRFGTSDGGGASHPDLGYATSIPRGVPFSAFFRSHRRAAKDLSNYFLKAGSPSEFIGLARSVRGRVNETLFIYALSFVILRKKELRSLPVPTVVEIFPNKFVQQEEIMKAQHEVNRMQPGQTQVVIDQEFTGTLLKPEHRISYWREDYGMNSHHWHWHLINPVELETNRDRKGELFYYMHQQMLARYDMERLSARLNRVIPLNNWRVPIEDGYFPKLTVNNSGRAWGSRQDNTMPQDIRRDDFGIGFITLNEMEIWYGRILDAVHQGFMIDRKGERVQLTDDILDLNNGKRGIDILGDTFEADAEMSVNYPFYGDVHNFGHVVIGFIHDPDFAHKEQIGAIGDPLTSMRDPAFYRWHKFIDLLFQEYKLQQRPYNSSELSLEGVKLERVGVRQGDRANDLQTYWNTREFEAGRGLDFNSPVPVSLRFTHLDHRPFNYHIQITNNLSTDKEVTVRIFLAPTLDERGLPMSFMDQRLFWAEMDKFTYTLTPGLNQLVRASKDSSITSPEEATFRQLETGRVIEFGTREGLEFGACGCGWPQHLLLPRGKPEGMDYQLFFMLTDREKDRVEQPPGNRVCSNGASFCGILDAKYPDRQPMGFPFDRRNPERVFTTTIQTAEDFAGVFDNMLMQNIKITFTDAMMN